MSVAAEKSKVDRNSTGGGVWETVKVVLQALILALLVRTFLYQPFNIPSGSMKDTLLIGDYLFVSKFAYGYSKYSFPFSPDIFDGRIWAGAGPQPGDIAVFKLPRDNATDYIKRVIGVPGDRVQMIGGVLHINGVAVRREKLLDVATNDAFGRERRAARYRETLPNGVSYETLDLEPNGMADDTEEFLVPEGHYFMMGDNRDNSLDSRISPMAGGVGFVPLENFIGRAEVIFFSVDEDARAWQFWRWPWTVRLDRLFTGL